MEVLYAREAAEEVSLGLCTGLTGYGAELLN